MKLHIKFHKRYLYLVISIISVAAFFWAAFGHIYRLRVETKGLCEELQSFCFLNQKVRVDILDEHRAVVLNIVLLILGLSLIAFVISTFSSIKKKPALKVKSSEKPEPDK